MKKPIRYILYVLIGVSIYYVIGADENPEVLNDLHSIAPALIIGIVILMVVMRYLMSKRNKDND